MSITSYAFKPLIEEHQIYGYSPLSNAFIADVINVFQNKKATNVFPKASTNDVKDYRKNVAKLAYRLNNLVMTLARCYSKDYTVGDWEFNEEGIYLLNTSQETFRVVNSNNFFSGTMNSVEYSLFIFSLALNQLFEFITDACEIIHDGVIYWYEKMKSICRNSQNGFNKQLLIQALD